MATKPLNAFVPESKAPVLNRSTFRGEAAEAPWYAKLQADVEESLGASQFMTVGHDFRVLDEKLNRLERLEQGWDSYDAEPPSGGAIRRAKEFLQLLRATLLVPNKILPSGEGGVALSFYSENGRDAYIEFLNDGENQAVLYANSGEFVEHEVEMTPEGASRLAQLIRDHRAEASK